MRNFQSFIKVVKKKKREKPFNTFLVGIFSDKTYEFHQRLSNSVADSRMINHGLQLFYRTKNQKRISLLFTWHRTLSKNPFRQHQTVLVQKFSMSSNAGVGLLHTTLFFWFPDVNLTIVLEITLLAPKICDLTKHLKKTSYSFNKTFETRWTRNSEKKLFFWTIKRRCCSRQNDIVFLYLGKVFYWTVSWHRLDDKLHERVCSSWVSGKAEKNKISCKSRTVLWCRIYLIHGQIKTRFSFPSDKTKDQWNPLVGKLMCPIPTRFEDPFRILCHKSRSRVPAEPNAKCWMLSFCGRLSQKWNLSESISEKNWNRRIKEENVTFDFSFRNSISKTISR